MIPYRVATFLLGTCLGLAVAASIWPTLIMLKVEPLIITGLSLMIIIVGLVVGASRRERATLGLVVFRFCTSRSILLTAILMLATKTPLTNINHNLDELSKSYSCTQEMSKEEVSGYTEEVNILVDKISLFSEKICDDVMLVRSRILKLARMIERAHRWLEGMSTRCNEKMDSPYGRCIAGFDRAKANCVRKVTKIFKWVCSTVDLVKRLCGIVKIAKIVCKITHAISNFIKLNVPSKITDMIDRVHEMLYVRVKVEVHTNIEMEKSKTLARIKGDIKQDMHEYFGPIVRFLITNLPMMASVLSLPWIIFRSHVYSAKYLKFIKHDNCYLTPHLKKLDAIQKHNDAPTVLPLELWEHGEYIGIFSMRITDREARGLMFASVRVISLIAIVVALFYIDWALYMGIAGLTLPLAHTRFADAHQAVEVEGTGAMANMLKILVNTMEKSQNYVHDLSPCLPKPSPPNYEEYFRIGIWVITYAIFEVIIIVWRHRMYHVIMSVFHPERETLRSEWLFRHILNERQRRYNFQRVTLIYQAKMNATLSDNIFFIENYLTRYNPLRVQCCCCADTTFTGNFLYCVSQQCPGVFCETCLALIEDICPLCGAEYFSNKQNYGE